jgi:hypothetical protein
MAWKNLRFNKGSISEMERTMKRIEKTVELRVMQGMKEHADIVMAESNLQVPVDTFTLGQTGYVGNAYKKGGEITIDLGYASPSTDIMNPITTKMASTYAVEVHEDLNVFHPVGKAKFLEDPLVASLEAFNVRMKQTVANALLEATKGAR